MGKRSREKATGRSFKERLSEGKEILKARRPAKRMVKRMQKSGDYSEFRDYVRELEDDEIEWALAKLDRAINRQASIGRDPNIVNEYAILVEERTRREKDG